MPKFYVKLFYLSFFLLLLSNLTLGQGVQPIIELADKHQAKNEPFAANYYYLKAMNVDSTNVELLYKLGQNYTSLNNNESAARYYQKAYILDRNKEIEGLSFQLAEAYRNSSDYRKARRYYNQALRPYRRDKESYWYKRINISKKSAAWASRIRNNTTETPSNLGKNLNSDYAEFASTYYKDQVFFSAIIADSAIGNNVVLDQDMWSRIYVKNLTDNSTPTEVKFNDKEFVQIKNAHLANPSLLGDQVYFSVCDTLYNCAVWNGNYKKGKIQDIQLLNENINSPNSNNTQAQITTWQGDTILYFVSDRERGIGKLDIWKSKLHKGKFLEAENLGSSINSPDDEITPYFDSESATLYFSSNWYMNFGGFDIYQSKIELNQFQAPENLGKGINTFNNEYYFQPKGEQATFTSNRKDGNIENSNSCCNDLFQVKYLREIIEYEEIDTVNEEILNKYLPLSLYFHNDQPNPNSKDTTTSTNYKQLATEYIGLEEVYIEKYISKLPEEEQVIEELDLDYFFRTKVEKGVKKLDEFTPKLLEELEKGFPVELSIRGFSSSLSNKEYNKNLAIRRIKSLVNYFKQAENGKLAPFIASGDLKFKQIPFGDLAVSNKLDVEDKLAAVYSIAAAEERKIELICLSSGATNSVINVNESPIIEIKNATEKKGENGIATFSIENTGTGTLKIYNITSPMEGVTINYQKELLPNTSAKVQINLNEVKLSSKKMEFIIVSNAHNQNLLPLVVLPL